MTETFDHQHPFYSVKEYLIHTSKDWILEFSRYIYIEQGRTERRILLSQHLSNVTHNWLNFIMNDLEQNEEFAFHSRLYCHGQEFHMPLVDFSARMNPEDARDLICTKCNFERTCIKVYDSGRSLHAYYLKLVSKDEWMRYLGCLLYTSPSPRDRTRSRMPSSA